MITYFIENTLKKAHSTFVKKKNETPPKKMFVLFIYAGHDIDQEKYIFYDNNLMFIFLIYFKCL